MKPLPIVLIFSGYALIYAAVAAGGKFATEPWAGLFADAYTETGKNTQGPNYRGTGMSKADYFASTNAPERRAGLMPGPAGPTPIRRRPSYGINLPGK